MKGPTIVMLVANEVLADPRVYRAATAASAAGYQVAVVCAVREGAEGWARLEGFTVYRIRIGKLLMPVKKGLKAIAAGWGRLARLLPSAREAANAPEGVGRPAYATRRRIARWLRDAKLLQYILRLNAILFCHCLRLKADIYHANDLDTLPAGFLLAKIHRGKLLYDAHELYPELLGDFSPLLRQTLRGMERVLARGADGIVTVNTALAQILQQRLQRKLPVVVMNCPPYAPKPRADEGRAGGNALRPVKIIYQGLYHPERGLEELCLSSRYLQGGVLFLRGAGPRESALRRLVARNDLAHKVFFLAPVPMVELVDALAGFDVGVVSNLPVTLNNTLVTPNKLFEYMMAGLALATSDLPELRRIVLDNDVGVVFNPQDPKDIARAINELIGDRERLKERQRKALKCAQELYNWEKQSQKLLQVYRALAP